MPDSFKFWITYVVLVTAVLVIGWNQPLRYRFMSKQEVAAMYASTPPPPPGAWMWEANRSSKLDRGAYGRRTSSGYAPSPYYYSR
jgi:hypothetical protein